MTPQRAAQVSADILSHLRELADYFGCRIDVSSDDHGMQTDFCCTASDEGRTNQGFGATIPEAVRNFREQPARRSTANRR